ncbi:MAG: type I 3-dehydroquinate dehydratase [Candidatus Omnitrophota bacterium]
MMKIGKVEIRAEKPALVGVVADKEWESVGWKMADILEVRLDHLPGGDVGSETANAFLQEITEKTKKPIILTIRRPEESEPGQEAFLPDKARLCLFSSLMPLADAVDIEVDSVIAARVVQSAKKNRRTRVIGSYHNFRRVPPDRVLYEKMRRAGNLGADIFKLACCTEEREEIVRLFNFCHIFSKKQVVCVIAMGKRNKLFRMVAPLFGSALVYVSLTAKTAPGQPEIKDFAEDFRRFYP